MRIAATDRAVSTLIVDGENRVLILNANGPQDARSVIGTLSRPWEAKPSTVIVSADRGNVEALWEALQRLEPRQLIVAGAPGANPAWLAIERHCQESGINVSYLEFETEIPLAELKLTIVPPEQNSQQPAGSYVKIKYGTVTAAVELSDLPESNRFHLIVSNDTGPHDPWSDLLVATTRADESNAERTISLEPGERIDAVLAPDEIRIQGRPAQGFDWP
jgi:hypothetical protein